MNDFTGNVIVPSILCYLGRPINYHALLVRYTLISEFLNVPQGDNHLKLSLPFHSPVHCACMYTSSHDGKYSGCSTYKPQVNSDRSDISPAALCCHQDQVAQMIRMSDQNSEGLGFKSRLGRKIFFYFTSQSPEHIVYYTYG